MKKKDGKAPKQEGTKPTREDLAKAQKEEAQERSRICTEELRGLLEKYDCRIACVPYIDAEGAVRAAPKIVAQVGRDG